MKFSPRILVGVSVFLSLYIGALYAFAVNVAPGTVLDPAGLPGAYTVSLIGYDSAGDVFVEKDFGGGLTGGYQLTDDVLGTGVAGSGLYLTEGDDVNITGVADFGFTSNISVLYYTDITTEDIVFLGTGKIGGDPTVIMNAGNDVTGDTVSASLSLSSGLFVQGKDDLNSSVTFTVSNESGDQLIQVMNDGTFEAARSTASGDFVLGTYDFIHPITSDPITFSGSRITLTGGETLDSGVVDGVTYQSAGSHYLSSLLYQGFDVNNSDASLFAFDLSGSNAASAIVAHTTDMTITATPNGTNVNRIKVNGNTDGIVFTGADDLTTSVLAQFENDSGDELLQIKNDGSFVSETTGGLQLINKNAQSLTVIGSVPVAGAFFADSTMEYVNGLVDFSGIGGDIYPEMATIDKNTLDSFYFVVDSTAARMGFSNNYGAGGSNNFAIGATGAEYSAVDDLSTTEGFRIENDSGTTLFSVYNDGTVLLPNILTTTPKSGINQAGAAVTIAGGKGTGIAAGGSVIFQTSDVLTPPQSTVVQSLTTKLTLAGSGNLTMASLDKGNGVAGSVLEIGRNTNSTNTGAGSVNFLSKSGTAGYVWQDAAGNVRINTSAPSNANDTAGTVLGNQTSTRETKQDITDYTDYAGALSKIIDAPLHTFRYIREVEGYGTDSPLAKTRLGYIADEVDPIFMTGNAIDQVSVNGLLMASVKQLDLKINSIVELARDDSFVTYLREFFADVANGISEFVAGTIRARDRLCIDDICLTKDQLRSLIESQSLETNSTFSGNNDDPSISDDNSTGNVVSDSENVVTTGDSGTDANSSENILGEESV